MFDSLDDQMKMDQQKESSASERYMIWAVVLVVSILLFGGLYYGVRMLE